MRYHNKEKLTRVAVSDLLMIKNFKSYTVGKVNENLAIYGIDTLPSILYILTCGNTLDYAIQSVIIIPEFVKSIIEGQDENVIAFTYTHKLLYYDKNGEESKGVVIYYEDNLVRITNYHNPVFSVLTDTTIINNEPNMVKYNEFHPSMVNISNILSIN